MGYYYFGKLILYVGPNKGFERFWQPWVWNKAGVFKRFLKRKTKLKPIPKAIKNKERRSHPKTKRTIIRYHANLFFKKIQDRSWATTLENCWGLIFYMGPNKGFEGFLAALAVKNHNSTIYDLQSLFIFGV